MRGSRCHKMICPLTLALSPMERGQIYRHYGRLIFIGLSLICRKATNVSGDDVPLEHNYPAPTKTERSKTASPDPKFNQTRLRDNF